MLTDRQREIAELIARGHTNRQIAAQLYLSENHRKPAHQALRGGTLLLGGRLGDIYGRRRTLVCGLAVFAAGGLVAGMAPGIAVLVTARVLQGFGAAAAVPAALALIGSLFSPGPERTRGAVPAGGDVQRGHDERLAGRWRRHRAVAVSQGIPKWRERVGRGEVPAAKSSATSRRLIAASGA